MNVTQVPNVYLTALGCRLNEAELQMWAEDFSTKNIAVGDEIERADIIVINTCAVTGEAARKSRQTIRKLHRSNPQAKLVVTGCYASLEQQQAQNLLGVDLVVANKEKGQLPAMALELLDSKTMPFAATEPEESALFKRNRERAFIKIQDGCRYRCTYCIVTVARGEESSRTIDELLAEIKRLQQSGIQEIVLTGVHVGGYGSDLGTSLHQLVVEILDKTEIPRIRFASVEPWDLPENFFELFRNPRLMPHMHLPIQSGSNRILRKMSRRCKAETFLSLVNKARSVIPDFNVTTDIIVGFPGETEQDFELSKDIIESAQFGHVHIFSYSDREGTKATGLPDKIDNQIKKDRSQRLHLIAAKTKISMFEKMINKKVSVLWEGRPHKHANGLYRISGHTENYYKVFVDLEESIDISNMIMRCQIIAFDKNSMMLEVKLTESVEKQNPKIDIRLVD